jgi:hypothetical protein
VKWTHRECEVTITTSKTGARFRSVVKILRPHEQGTALLMMGDSFPTAEMAENYGRQVARDWIDENVK